MKKIILLLTVILLSSCIESSQEVNIDEKINITKLELYENNDIGLNFRYPNDWGKPYVKDKSENKPFGIIGDYYVNIYTFSFHNRDDITLQIATDNQGVKLFYFYGNTSRGPDTSGYEKNNPKKVNISNICKYMDIDPKSCSKQNNLITFSKNYKSSLDSTNDFYYEPYSVFSVYRELEGKYSGLFGRIKYDTPSLNKDYDEKILMKIIEDLVILKF